MSIGDSMKKLIGIEELEDDDEITEEEVSAARDKIAKQAPKRSPMSETITDKHSASSTSVKSGDRRFSVTGTSSFKLVLIEPKTFEECPKLVDSLKGRRPVIINLEKLETEVAKKIFDFLSGATYALNGNVQKVANNIFIFAPENVDIAGGQPEEKPGFEFTRDEKDDAPSSPWR